MKQKDAPAFDFYPERWLVGTAAMSDSEQLSYLRLLCHQWTMDGLPEDVAVLKRLAGRGVTPAVLEKFPVVDGKRRNSRLEIVRAEQRKRIADRSAQRKIAAEARWSRERVKQPENDAGRIPAASVSHMREGMRGDAHHPPPTTHPSVLLEKEPKDIEVLDPEKMVTVLYAPLQSVPDPPQQGKTSRLPTTPHAIRLAKLFHRRLSTEWTQQEITAYRRLCPINEEDLAAVEEYYAANWPPCRDENVLRHDLKTLLGNWPGEVDRANTFKLAKPRTNGHNGHAKEAPKSFAQIEREEKEAARHGGWNIKIKTMSLDDD